MKFSTLSEEEFTNYTKKHFKHYTQSIELYNYRNKINHEAHIVGVKNDKNEVIAACLLTEARIFNSTNISTLIEVLYLIISMLN